MWNSKLPKENLALIVMHHFVIPSNKPFEAHDNRYEIKLALIHWQTRNLIVMVWIDDSSIMLVASRWMFHYGV